jgi:hypothetical protein
MAGLSAAQTPRRHGDAGTSFAVRAAAAAPSVQNTQPWHFSSSPGLIRLYADLHRRLPEVDPAGREMVISCGAALFNLRLAMRHLGFAADTRLLPDTRRPALLAEVRWGWYAPPTPEEDSLYGSITRRRTHRGPFTAQMPPPLITELIHAVRQEHADLHVLYGTDRLPRLAALVQEAGHRGDRGRDRGAYWRRGNPRALGVVALLTTRDDRRLGWLTAGQALQRLLLHAQAHDVRAALHTEPLELPATREQIRAEFISDGYPQMLLRLGRVRQPP